MINSAMLMSQVEPTLSQFILLYQYLFGFLGGRSESLKSSSKKNGSSGDLDFRILLATMSASVREAFDDSALHAHSPAASDSSASSVVMPLTICDECEDQPAALDCEDCGLVYCVACDKRRHRKGKLVFHQRKRIEHPKRAASTDDPARWSESQVADWLGDHELDVFLPEVSQHHIDGAFLLSPQMETFLDGQSSASRGHKKKLLRELQKLKSDTGEGNSSTPSSTYASPSRTSSSSGFASPLAPAPSPPAAKVSSFNERNSLRRMGVNLRVNIDAQPSAAPERHFSPVTSLRARATHGQIDELKGRVRRSSSGRHSELTLDENASTPTVAVNKSVERRATPVAPVLAYKSGGMPPPLQMDFSAHREIVTSPTETNDPDLSARPGRDLKSIRQALGGLDMDMVKIKKDGQAVEASFDFSAEGRLQTQGFEINTNGIANAPFPNQVAASKRRNSPHGTREYLVVLNELGHGASGKVYKALYIPTFKLVAVKVIRVFDQKKRHQMVRELKSLYANWAPIDDSAAKAACEELVVFFDAYTNPEIGSVSIVLEFMDGGSLEDYMQKCGKCSEREIANIAFCGLKGLAFLHEHHQLHRDIKLSNMLINQEGVVKISDFGISRDLESTLAKAATFTGTLLYMAPERISGGLYSYPSDIWSFGLAVMACAIGKLPVPTKEGYWGVVHAVQEQPSPKLSDYGDDYSPELCDFVDLCLRKNPMTRPPASQLLEHPFIKNNYQAGVRHSVDIAAANVPQKREKQLQELDTIAKQVRSWYQDNAERLLSPSKGSTESDDVLRQTSHEQKMLTLATQLRLPVELVAEKFRFMDSYK